MFGFGNFEGKYEEKKIKRKNRKKEKVKKNKNHSSNLFHLFSQLYKH